MHFSSPQRRRLLALAALLSGIAACARNSAAPTARVDDAATLAAGFGPSVQRDLETLRNATLAFADVKAAHAVGYPTALPACVADSTMGGMGRHYYDRKIADDSLEIGKPEMLIYAPLPDGGMQLVAVEYIVPYSARPATATPPRLFGQEFRPHAAFKYWYLHVWAWKRNAAGLFADWNPAVSCPPR